MKGGGLDLEEMDAGGLCGISTPLDPAVGMPAQIYLWSESAERGFIEKTSSAIILLLIFLIVVNFVSVYFRKKYEKKW